MARGIYTVTFSQVSFTTAGTTWDFFEFDAAADKPIELMSVFIGNKTEVGDAAEEMVAYAIIRGHTTTGSGGAAVTPRPLDPSDGAASFAAEAANDTIASAGTALFLHEDTFNVRTGLQLILPPDMRSITRGADLLVVRMLSTLTDDVTFSG
ncbi:MAG TPA: hypothetical protein VJ398_00210, partial [Acidimicrobiia bacterium]|nr:hypothetical protein [Acidimicrobiia bacterium]